MLIQVDRHNGVPTYRQIMDQIRFHVAGGLLKAGDELPSTRALAEQLDVNPMTVSKAYNLLEHDGLLARRPGMALVIRRTGAAERRARRREQLRRCLAPAVTQVRQLGVDDDEALAAFEELLAENASMTEGN